MVDAPTRAEAALAGLAGIAGVAGSYAVAGNTPRFVAAPIDALIVQTTPGSIVTWMIENVGDAAHLLHLGPAVALAVALLGGGALAGILLGRRRERPFAGIVLAAGLAWLLTAAVTGDTGVAAGGAAPVAVFTAVAIDPGEPGRVVSRRRVLGAAAGALATVAGGVGLGTVTSTGPEREGIGGAEAATIRARMETAADRELDIAGDIPGLVSSFEEFYNVDIAQFDPALAPEDWSLTITGEVAQERTVSFEELTAMPTEHRFVTLRCVGEDLNGHKLDNALWTGTPIEPLLAAADPEGRCDCVMLRAEDDYFVQFPVEALRDGFLAWGMNGEALPQSHGHPVRVLVPGHWGETNVKWLSEIELLDEPADGYWEQRGWQGTGPVNTVAKLWSDTRLENGNVELAGHAYAGTRGIDRVEVSTDGGATWTDAALSDPLPGDDVWRQWRHEFTPDGTHEVVVRAVDGEGTRQPQERSDPAPSGATGWVHKTVET